MLSLATSLWDLLTLAGFLLGVVAVWLGSRHLKHLKTLPRETKTVVHSARRWRRRAFEQGLHYLGEYTSAHAHVSSEPSTRSITDEDIRAWGRSVMLTSASDISRYSQGKANLFVVNDVTNVNGSRVVTLRAKQFVGGFPIAQLTTLRTENPVYNYRDMPVSEQSTATIAGLAAFRDRIEFAAIGNAVSDEERRLGTTHILAIPVCKTVADVEPGDAAVVTIDFRLPLRVRVLWVCESWAAKGKILRRAEVLQKAMREFAQALASSASQNA